MWAWSGPQTTGRSPWRKYPKEQQTNQAAARFKLMQKMPQSNSYFAEWYPWVKEQAERCIWQGYDGSMAARDAILLQTQDKKLQQKLLAEDLLRQEEGGGDQHK